MHVSPSRQFWLPLMHSLISRRDTAVTSKNYRSSGLIRRNIPEDTVGSAHCIRQVPHARGSSGRAPSGVLRAHHHRESKSSGFSPLLSFRSIALSEHLLSKCQALYCTRPEPEPQSRDHPEPEPQSWDRPETELQPWDRPEPRRLPISSISQMRSKESLGASPGPFSRSRIQSLVSPQPQPQPAPPRSVYIPLDESRGWKQARQTPGNAGEPALGRPASGGQAEAEAPEGCDLPSRCHPESGGTYLRRRRRRGAAGSPQSRSRRPPGPCLGTAACRARHLEAEHPRDLLVLRWLGRGQSKGPQGGLTQQGRVPRLEPPAAFTAPLLPQGDLQGLALAPPGLLLQVPVLAWQLGGGGWRAGRALEAEVEPQGQDR